jgi:hypothetical protein
VVEALREAISEAQSSGASKGENAEDDYRLKEIPEVPVVAPLDKQVLADLRDCLEEFEKRAADEFSRNKWAQAQKKTRTPVSPNVADKLYDALQDFVVREGRTWLFFEPFY